MTLEDLCYLVCSALDAAGAQAVLTGGSAATFYAPHVYQSDDADFILTFGNSALAAQALSRIGFTEKDGIYYSAATHYTVEFPPGPLMIGSDYIKDFASVRRDDQILYVLHPSDCVRDRLLWYYHYNDFSALSAAVGIAQLNAVDMRSIREWSERERSLDQFELFNRQVSVLRDRASTSINPA